MKTLKLALGALRLDENALYDIGFDRRETWPAVVLFGLCGLGAGLSWIFSNPTWPVTLAAWLGFSMLALGLIGETARFSALFLFGGGVRRDEVVRLAGFAMLPMILGSLPYAGVLAVLWALVIFYKGTLTYFALGPGRTLALMFFSIGAAFVFWALANGVVVAILSAGE